MHNAPSKNASTAGGAHVNQAGGLGVTNKNKQRDQSTTDDAVLASMSSATAVQAAKVLALLRQGPKTTLELRHHGIWMPASRIFYLKRDHDCVITTELVPLFDDEGIRHSRCARYSLHADKSLGGEA